MENIQLALLLEELALLLELTGVEAFKTRAYRRAAKSIQDLPEDVRLLHANNALRQIPGVGAGIAAKIDEWLRTGSIREQEELKSQFPPVLLELARIPGIGVKTARQLHETLGVTSLDDLARHLREGTIRQVPKLGPQAVARIQRGVEYHLQHRGRVLLAVAVLLERHLGDFCRRIPGVSRVEPTGALRRRRPLLTRVELLVAAEDPSGFWEEIEDYPSLDGAPQRDGGTIHLQAQGLVAQIQVVPPEQFPFRWYETSGSPGHLAQVAQVAAQRGISFPDGKSIAFAAGETRPITVEADIYHSLGLPWIPPELREGREEVAQALAGELPHLVERGDLQGDLHLHSHYSDGTVSIKEMALAAKAAGLSYLAVCDHSQSLKIARGLTPQQLRQQRQEIAQVNGELDGFTVLAGIEVDILPDGTLDLPDEVLGELDLVVASVHQHFNLNRKEMTRRILRAMENPHVDIIGHVTGRLLGRRSGYEVDVEEVLQAAARTGTVLEINSHPERLDLDETHVREGLRLGVKFAINSDAHAPVQLGYLTYGLWVARRAGLSCVDVVNCWPLEQLRAFLRKE